MLSSLRHLGALGVRQIRDLVAGVASLGNFGRDMCPCSASLSTSLFPSMVTWDGTLTQWIVRPGLSSLRPGLSSFIRGLGGGQKSLWSDGFERGSNWAELIGWPALLTISRPGFETPTDRFVVGCITVRPFLVLTVTALPTACS